jgi:type IV pilus biogenesis protein CpaD/CtpE
MNINSLWPLSAIGAAMLLGACSDRLPLSQPDNFGAAVRHNVEMQIVNPTAQPEPGPTPMDGSRAALAFKRYQTDQVKQPKSLSTSGISLGGSGGGK